MDAVLMPVSLDLFLYLNSIRKVGLHHHPVTFCLSFYEAKKNVGVCWFSAAMILTFWDLTNQHQSLMHAPDFSNVNVCVRFYSYRRRRKKKDTDNCRHTEAFHCFYALLNMFRMTITRRVGLADHVTPISHEKGGSAYRNSVGKSVNKERIWKISV
jgi:hypothetical protein